MKVLRELSSPVEIHSFSKEKDGKLSVLLFGSVGLPQHSVKGYSLYLSDRTDNFSNVKAYAIPNLEPGGRTRISVDDLFDGKGFVTVVRPTGYIATQKAIN